MHMHNAYVHVCITLCGPAFQHPGHGNGSVIDTVLLTQPSPACGVLEGWGRAYISSLRETYAKHM